MAFIGEHLVENVLQVLASLNITQSSPSSHDAPLVHRTKSIIQSAYHTVSVSNAEMQAFRRMDEHSTRMGSMNVLLEWKLLAL